MRALQARGGLGQRAHNAPGEESSASDRVPAARAFGCAPRARVGIRGRSSCPIFVPCLLPVSFASHARRRGVRFAMSSLLIVLAGLVPDDESVALSALAREEGLESAADLGYLFASAAEAREAGVAASWLRARQAATLPAAELRRLVLQAAANAGGRGVGNDRPAPSPRHVGPPKPVFLPTAPSAPAAVRGPRPRTSPQCAEAADQVARRRAALEVARLSAGWRPGLSPEQRALVASKKGPVAIRLAAFEPACLRGALRAWASWCAWCAKRGLGDDPAAAATCPVAVDTFVLSHRTARSSARAIWSRLHWLRKHAHAPFVLEAPPPVADPATGEVPPPSAQAVVLEPEMFFWAENLLRRRVQEDAPLRLASAAVLAMVFGCVRYTHLLRSRPLERCECAAWFRCFRGKQGRPGARAAFDWALPRGPAADLIWQEWHAQVSSALPPAARCPRALSSTRGLARRYPWACSISG